jgi:flagellar basal body-associated protein FliL
MEENKFSEFNEVKNTEIAEEKSKNNNGGKSKKKLPVVKIAILVIIVSLILVLAQFLLTGSLFTFNKMTESAKKTNQC